MMNTAPENKALEKKLNVVAYILSTVVILLVVFMRKIHLDVDMSFKFLPPVNAFLNTLVSFALVAALYFIKQKNIAAHRTSIYIAMALSSLFLLLYVVYHITTPDTKFLGTGWIRPVYFFILITHVVLAAAILPFIFLTFTRAYTNQFERHKKMARWVFPLWLYVATTGPICYLLLRPYY